MTVNQLIQVQSAGGSGTGNEWEIVDALLEKDSTLVNMKNNKGMTPLHMAISTGKELLVEHLLDPSYGADKAIMMPQKGSETPILPIDWVRTKLQGQGQGQGQGAEGGEVMHATFNAFNGMLALLELPVKDTDSKGQKNKMEGPSEQQKRSKQVEE